MSFFSRKKSATTTTPNKYSLLTHVLAPSVLIAAIGGGIALATGAALTAGAAVSIGLVTAGGAFLGTTAGGITGFFGALIDKHVKSSEKYHGVGGISRMRNAIAIGSLAFGIAGAYGGYKFGAATFSGKQPADAANVFNTAAAPASPEISATTLTLTAQHFKPRV